MLGVELPVGAELLGYRVEGLLGRGGMGVVYVAEDLGLGRRVALKLLAPALAADAAFRERFLAESKLAASLDHPGVVPIYEAGEVDGRLFIAMRYVEGSDLKARLREGALTAARTFAVCAQVADALDFAHARGLVHRDVKPSNVLLDGRDHVYLADFGLTKRVEDPHAAEPGLLGTIDYVAPEQIRGERVDGRADQYSLACLLCECLTGEPPFPRSTDAAVLFAHLEERPAAPPGLGSVIERALAKLPADRYGTCIEFIGAAAEAAGLGERAWSRLPGLPFLLAGAVCPFKGLGFFDRSDAEYFCGRERVVSDVVARLARSMLVGILGPSGIGKSSLLRAGVLPTLSGGALPGSAGWRQFLVRPGEHPGAELTRALGGQPLDVALARLSPGERIVVAIDQLEELFTICHDERERAAFLDQLHRAGRDHDRRALVLVSLRADFYGRLASYPEFAQLLSANHVLVGPMDRDELARAIEEPAARAGLEVEPPLVEALVSDVAGEPGGLPLLSTMLLELWGRRDGRTLRLDSYLASGGVRGAVARLAERAFLELDDRERGVVRTVMLRLVGGEEGALVRRRVPLAEFDHIDGAERVVATLAQARLVTISDEEVEVSHEALLSEWPRCRAWLEEDRVGRRVHQHLITSAREWDEGGRDRGELYRGVRLTAALEWAAERPDRLNPLEREFLDASRLEADREARRQRTQNRRLRGLATGIGLLLVLALIAVVFAEVQRTRADNQRRTAQSLQLAAFSRATLAQDPELSALLALRGLRISDTDQAAQALRDALLQSRLLATLRAPGYLFTAAFSPDGRKVVTAGENGTAQIWSTSSHRQLAVLTDPSRKPLVSAAFSPDGSKIVTASTDGTARIWTDDRPRQLAVLTEPHRYPLLTEPHQYPLASAAFSPDGKTIVTAGSDGAEIWSARSHMQLAALSSFPEPGGLPLLSAQFSPDGSQIVTANRDYRVRIWSARTRTQLGVITAPGTTAFDSAAFSPDGRKIVTAGTDGTARIWSATTHRQLAAMVGPTNAELASAAFSPDGKQVVTAGADQTARVWDAGTGNQLFVLAGHTGSVQTAAFSPDGRTVVTASSDGTARLWNVTQLELRGELTRVGDGLVLSAAFTPDGKKILTTSVGPGGPVRSERIWSARNHRQLGAVTEPLDVDAAFSPDGQRVVTSGRNGVRILNASTHKQLASLATPDGSRTELVAFTRDGTEVLATTPRDIVVWSVITHKVLGVLLQAGSATPHIASFSPDGQSIVTAGFDDIVRFWGVRSHKLVRTLGPGTSPVINATFSPDGQKVVTAGEDGTARIWSVRNGQQLGVIIETDHSELATATFSPDGKDIVTASIDGTARIWSAVSFQQLTVMSGAGSGPLYDAEFSPNGKEIVTARGVLGPAVGGLHGAVQIWSTELAGPARDLERIAQMRITRQLTPTERRTYMAGL